MFKKNLFKSIAVTTAVYGLSFITPISSTLTNATPAPLTAHASTIMSDGPWEIDSDGVTPFTQQLYNGNEIYYSIAPNDKYTNYFQQAVSDWNALGVIKLVQVNWNDPESEVRMQYNNNAAPDDPDGNSYNGETTFGRNSTGVWANVGIYSPANDESKVIKQTVADHELGHALGFDHDNRKPNNGKIYKKYHLTMYKYQGTGMKFYKLGGIEQHMLEDHYHLTASVDLSNMNC